MKRAFTLIELLVAISVIVVLAGISIPVIGVVRKQAKDAQCRNNLKQLFTGITGYRMESNQIFPQTLTIMFEEGQALAGESRKLLLCPFDGTKGNDATFNRHSQWASLPELRTDPRNNQPLSLSYLFEAAHVPLNSNAQNWTFGDGTLWSTHGTTWGVVKAAQLRKGGSVPSTGGPGRPFNESQFPIIRCFYHAPWATLPPASLTEKVMNVSWDGSIFMSMPFWEHQMDPGIPLPTFL